MLQVVDGDAVDEGPDSSSVLVQNGEKCRDVCPVMDDTLLETGPISQVDSDNE